jgi:hypothetical protein
VFFTFCVFEFLCFQLFGFWIGEKLLANLKRSTQKYSAVAPRENKLLLLACLPLWCSATDLLCAVWEIFCVCEKQLTFLI